MPEWEELNVCMGYNSVLLELKFATKQFCSPT